MNTFTVLLVLMPLLAHVGCTNQIFREEVNGIRFEKTAVVLHIGNSSDQIFHMEHDQYTPGNILFATRYQLFTANIEQQNITWIAGEYHANFTSHNGEENLITGRYVHFAEFCQRTNSLLLVADRAQNLLWTVDRTTGKVSWFSGSLGHSVVRDGNLTTCLFYNPNSFATFDNETFYIAQPGAGHIAIMNLSTSEGDVRHVKMPIILELIADIPNGNLIAASDLEIYKIDISDFSATLLAGKDGDNIIDGELDLAEFHFITTILKLKEDTLLVTEVASASLRVIDLNGWVSSICLESGNGHHIANCSLNNPESLMEYNSSLLLVGTIQHIIGLSVSKVSTTTSLTTTGRMTTSVGEMTTSGGEMKTSAGEMTTSVGEMTTSVSEMTTPVGEMTTSVGEMTTSVGEMTTSGTIALPSMTLMPITAIPSSITTTPTPTMTLTQTNDNLTKTFSKTVILSTTSVSRKIPTPNISLTSKLTTIAEDIVTTLIQLTTKKLTVSSRTALPSSTSITSPTTTQPQTWWSSTRTSPKPSAASTVKSSTIYHFAQTAPESATLGNDDRNITPTYILAGVFAFIGLFAVIMLAVIWKVSRSRTNTADATAKDLEAIPITSFVKDDTTSFEKQSTQQKVREMKTFFSNELESKVATLSFNTDAGNFFEQNEQPIEKDDKHSKSSDLEFKLEASSFYVDAGNLLEEHENQSGKDDKHSIPNKTDDKVEISPSDANAGNFFEQHEHQIGKYKKNPISKETEDKVEILPSNADAGNLFEERESQIGKGDKHSISNETDEKVAISSFNADAGNLLEERENQNENDDQHSISKETSEKVAISSSNADAGNFMGDDKHSIPNETDKKLTTSSSNADAGDLLEQHENQIGNDDKHSIFNKTEDKVEISSSNADAGNLLEEHENQIGNDDKHSIFNKTEDKVEISSSNADAGNLLEELESQIGKNDKHSFSNELEEKPETLSHEPNDERSLKD